MSSGSQNDTGAIVRKLPGAHSTASEPGSPASWSALEDTAATLLAQHLLFLVLVSGVDTRLVEHALDAYAVATTLAVSSILGLHVVARTQTQSSMRAFLFGCFVAAALAVIAPALALGIAIAVSAFLIGVVTFDRAPASWHRVPLALVVAWAVTRCLGVVDRDPLAALGSGKLESTGAGFWLRSGALYLAWWPIAARWPAIDGRHGAEDRVRARWFAGRRFDPVALFVGAPLVALVAMEWMNTGDAVFAAGALGAIALVTAVCGFRRR